MRQIDNMTPAELDTLALKGMTAPRTASERTYTAQHSPEWWGAFDSLNRLRATFDSETEAYFYVRNRGHMHQGTHKPIVNHADKLAEACKWLLSLYDERGEHREQYQDQCSVACEKAEAALAAYEESK